MKLQHIQKNGYRYNQVGISFDGKIKKLEVDENGFVQPESQVQARKLEELGFEPVDGESISDVDYALADRTVEESEEYITGIDDLERLKELRKLEAENKGRKNALQLIDDRIKDVKPEPETKDVEHESVEKQSTESEENGREDGEKVEE